MNAPLQSGAHVRAPRRIGLRVTVALVGLAQTVAILAALWWLR